MLAYVERREEGERFLDTFRRIGIKPFKERVYATDAKASQSDEERRYAANY